MYIAEINEQEHQFTIESAWPRLPPRKVAWLNTLVAVNNGLALVPTLALWTYVAGTLLLAACGIAFGAALPAALGGEAGLVLLIWIGVAAWAAVLFAWGAGRVLYWLYRREVLPVEVARLRRMAPFCDENHWTNRSN